jgi:hypothetical protein
MTPRSLKHTPSYEKPLTSDGAKNHDIFDITKNHIPSQSPRWLGIVSDGEGYGTECHGASVPLIELHNQGQKPQNAALSKSEALHIPSNMLGSMEGTPYAKTQWVGPQQASVPLVHCQNWGHKPQSVEMSDLRTPSRSPVSLGDTSNIEEYGPECYCTFVPSIEQPKWGRKPQNAARSKSKPIHIPERSPGSMGRVSDMKNQWVECCQASLPLVHQNNWGHKPQKVGYIDLKNVQGPRRSPGSMGGTSNMKIQWEETSLPSIYHQNPGCKPQPIDMSELRIAHDDSPRSLGLCSSSIDGTYAMSETSRVTDSELLCPN